MQLLNLDMGHIYAYENITLKAYMHSSLISFFPGKMVWYFIDLKEMVTFLHYNGLMNYSLLTFTLWIPQEW